MTRLEASVLDRVLCEGEVVAGHRPWPRVLIEPSVWSQLIDELASGSLILLGLWGEPNVVHMAVLDGTRVVVVSLAVQDNKYPSVGARHPPAVRLERVIRDLFGLEAEELEDTRPWLDHGCWGNERATGIPYDFLKAEGRALHQIPVGPIHAGIIEPGHFRFNCDGETVVRLEERLGYAHKGIEHLLSGATLSRGSSISGRVSGDSTVAYTLAFSHAVEAALGVEVPTRAVWLRAAMAEMERIANHIGDVGAICNDASFGIMLAHCAVFRETILRAASAIFGHRLMMDRIVPGGVTTDLHEAGIASLAQLVDTMRTSLPALLRLYDDTPSIQDRTVGAGILKPVLAKQFGAGGYIGRASGRDFDARRDLPYGPYGTLSLTVPVRTEGDVNARLWIRLEEIGASITLLERLITEIPSGPIHAPVPFGSGEGMAIVEAFRGDLLAWLRIENGVIARCHFRDASCFQWPLLEAAIEGNIVADFPLCNKSFNCSYAGHDL